MSALWPRRAALGPGAPEPAPASGGRAVLSIRGVWFEHEDGPPAPQRVGRETVAAATAWIRDHVAEPLFVWVHLFDPHVPYAPPRRYRTRFAETPDGPPPLLGNTAKRPPYTPEPVRTRSSAARETTLFMETAARTRSTAAPARI